MVAVFDPESVAWTGDPAGCTYSDVSGHDRVSVWENTVGEAVGKGALGQYLCTFLKKS